MSFPRLTSWLTFAALLATVAGGLSWLFFAFANDTRGRTLILPLAAHADTSKAAGVSWQLDPGGSRTAAEVRTLPEKAWQTPDGARVGVGAGHGATWLRVTLRNPLERPAHGILAMGYFFIDRVDCWVGEPPSGADGPAPGEGLTSNDGLAWRRARGGEAVPSADLTMWGRQPAFVINVPARGEQVVYLRLQDYYGALVNPEWWPASGDFHTAQAKGLLAEGIYFGALLALLGYNLTLWLRLRFADTGYYVLYLAVVLLFMFLARGHLPTLGWAVGSPVLETTLVVVTMLGAVFLIQFARVFLELPTRLPRGDRVVRWLRLLLALGGVGALTIPWAPYQIWMTIALTATVSTHVALLGLAVWMWRLGARQARFFGLSFGCLSAGTLPVAGLWWSGASDLSGAIHGIMIGSALEMLLLSLALADRFIQAQNDKAAAQALLVEETERRQALQEAYADELTEEVSERTADLEAANADKDRMLAVIGHDLRSPLAGLTQMADQLAGKAVPGPAALRFPADVAQVGRQMLLLIEDIVLWARLRTGAQPAAAVHAATGLVTPVVTLHRPLAARRGVALSMEVPPSLTVRTDLVLAQTLVRNLVGNAVKFARSRVDVSAMELQGAVWICVRDDGPGLPPPMAARLRGEAELSADGGGMGLRLSQEIGVVLGAALTVTMPESGGTEIRVMLRPGAAMGGEA